jgi:AcrR family transcriptional regulator
LSNASPQPRGRRSQEERSAETRARLLDATIACLIERGYAGTTTAAVAERAGVSRGAQLHHFPTRAELVVRAVAHLAKRRADELRREAAELPGRDDRLDAVLELMWTSFSGPLFYASLELWVAARTDPELHAGVYELERNVGRAMRELWREFVGDAASERDFDELVELSLHLLRGMALQRVLRDDDRERRRHFDHWKKLVSERIKKGAQE